MDRIGVVLVMLNPNLLQNSLAALDLNKVNPVAILIDGGAGKILNFNDAKIRLFSFAQIDSVVKDCKDFAWLICGHINFENDCYQMRTFLQECGVSKDNIINFDVLAQADMSWVANLHWAEQNNFDFFVTGGSVFELGVNFSAFDGLKGVNLASDNQDLR